MERRVLARTGPSRSSSTARRSTATTPIRLRPTTESTSRGLLFGDPHVHAEFPGKLHARGIISFSEAVGAKGYVGLLFVPKKNASQRVIFDTRIAKFSFGRLQRPGYPQPLLGA
eukprot:8312930-Pyramimonas_sp.AAC.1